MNLRNVTPIILAAVLIVLICILMFIRMKDWSIGEGFINFDVIFVLVYLVWIIIESKASKAEVSNGNKTADYGTCEIYAIGQAAVILSALWLTSVDDSPSIFQVMGFIIFLAGIAFRLWAVKTLGKIYSHMVRKVDEHEIIDSGPYRYIRHPAYAGMILANLGIVIFFFNEVTLLVFLLVLLPAIIFRILIEEKTLFKIKTYVSYAQDRSRLIPGIW